MLNRLNNYVINFSIIIHKNVNKLKAMIIPRSYSTYINTQLYIYTVKKKVRPTKI
jgi:hypothetical protein